MHGEPEQNDEPLGNVQDAHRERPRPQWAAFVVALLPGLIGAFHLFVCPLVPPRTDEPTTQAVNDTSDDRPSTEPVEVTEDPRVRRARQRIEDTLPLVFLSCSAACVVLGLLNVRHALWFAFLEACITTLALTVSRPQGACMGALVLPFIPFWPLIGVGRAIRSVFV